jgi:type II secretory pathway pseudopilin PulG
LRFRPRRCSEIGSSIFELVVAVGLLAVVLTVVYAALGSASAAVSGTDERLTNLGEARLLMSTASKDLRTATRLTADGEAFLLADSHAVRFYGNLNPTTGPKLIEITVDSQTQLVEAVTDPDADSIPPSYTYVDNAPRTRFVGRYVANAPDDPIFTYKDAGGNELGPTPLNATQRRQVRAVEIKLSIRKSTNLAVAPTTVVNEVRLPNLGYTVAVDD